ncbi:MAG: 30S ribosomal protein S12 methylthiotransferase RimO [Candidatus Omnitrophota bacterium]
MKKISIGMLSLGCPKTLVDSENILGLLPQREFRIAGSVTSCDIAILNTCAFIQDAKEESIERILELIELKKERRIRGILVVGCLVQRFPEALRDELHEVDGFIGSGDYRKVPEMLRSIAQGKPASFLSGPGYLAFAGDRRIALTPRHYRYLKISEGCDRLCSFCSIPNFRGRYRSREVPDLVKEVRLMVREGAREIILTGQDLTGFGKDTHQRELLPQLIRRVERISRLKWIRLLYAHPASVSSALIDLYRDCGKLCRYLDIPLQHISDPVLRRMRRGISQKRTCELLSTIRRKVPGIALRTTFIVGFPGETDKDFRELLDFMKVMRFERLGVFMYSREEGTAAAAFPDQIPPKIKEERWHQAMKLQQEIARSLNQEWIGRTVECIIDERDKGRGHWLGRTFMDAPEVDGMVTVTSSRPLQIGGIYPVQIQGAKEYDLVGKI